MSLRQEGVCGPPWWRPLHPEHSETRLLHGRVERRAEAQAQNHAGVGRIDDPIIPQSAERKTAERITPPASFMALPPRQLSPAFISLAFRSV